MRLERKRYVIGFIFLLPTFLAFFIFRYLPLLWTFYWSFHRVVLGRTLTFVGGENYARLFRDPVFYTALINTIKFTLIVVPCSVILSLFLGAMFNQKFRFKQSIIATYFFPFITPTVAVALIWEWIYHPTFGILNNFLESLQLPGQVWLSDPYIALYSIAVVHIWKYIGFYSVVVWAGLQVIPEEYYEAALVDGAGRLQCFSYITLPELKPTLTFLTITAYIHAIRAFDLIFVLTQGGPLNSTNVLMLYMYQTAFQRLDFGYACAIAVVFFLMALSVSLMQWRRISKVRVER